MSDYKHHGIPQAGTWGAMTAPVGARTDKAAQLCRSAIAALGNTFTSWQWEAPAPARMATRARGRD